MKCILLSKIRPVLTAECPELEYTQQKEKALSSLVRLNMYTDVCILVYKYVHSQTQLLFIEVIQFPKSLDALWFIGWVESTTHLQHSASSQNAVPRT